MSDGGFGRTEGRYPRSHCRTITRSRCRARLPARARRVFIRIRAVLWYEKRFFAPLDWAGSAVEVLFDGAQRFATVFLNGEALAEHKYGYTPFSVELSAKLMFGAENVPARAA